MIKPSWETDQGNRFRLFSLRELMEAIDGRILVTIGNALMELRLANSFRQLAGRSITLSPDGIDKDMGQQTRIGATSHLHNVGVFCERVGCAMTLLAVNRAIARLESPGVSLSEVASDSDHIYQLLIDELDSKLFLNLSVGHVPYYNNWLTGWELAIEKFPSIEFEIEEASKSMALNRYTSSVFHSMRILEVGL